jgi:hypothetical protein
MSPSRAALEAEILLLRHQLNILRRATPKRVGNSPIKPHQINLKRSLIERTINRFAGAGQPFGFTVGTVSE